jgi:NAD(P)-dependent dehydrogenase (short-subunit alcohol dehydrogenase family)
VGLRPQPVPTYAYDASKAALHALTHKLSAELAPAIAVNALALGYVPSRMSRGLLHYGSAAQLAAAIPLQRFGSASDVGGAALFLASRAGAWVTGTVLTVDGGTVAQPLTLVAGGGELL